MLAKATDPNGVKLGNWVITGGLIIQIIFFGFFIIVAGIFNYRLASYPTNRSKSLEISWQRYLTVLYGASALILIRSGFRVAQYIGGQGGVLLSSEIYPYIFDAALMFVTMVTFNIWHPSSIIIREKRAVLSQDSELEMANPGQGMRSTH